MSKKIIVAGTGCALADYLFTDIRFNETAFQKYRSVKSGDGGLAPGRLVFTEELEAFSGESYADIHKEITGGKAPTAINVGGPGLVSLINTAQLLSSENIEVHFYGGTGSDDTAEWIHQLVQKTPLNTTHYRRISQRRTPFTDVLSDQTYDNNHGERTFINNIGAAWDYTPDLLGSDFFKADIVCFGGTALVPQIHDSLTDLLSKAKDNGCVTVVNTVFDFRNEKKNPDQPWPLVVKSNQHNLIDLLVMDCEESLKISGQQTIDSAAEYFINLGISTLIITNGAQDLYAYSNGALFEKTALVKLPVSKKVNEDFKSNPALKGDTTGCGDNFVGGVIASLASQLSNHAKGTLNFKDALAWGIASGGYTCYYLGGTFIEKVQGEKRAIVEEFKNNYLQQIESK